MMSDVPSAARFGQHVSGYVSRALTACEGKEPTACFVLPDISRRVSRPYNAVLVSAQGPKALPITVVGNNAHDLVPVRIHGAIDRR